MKEKSVYFGFKTTFKKVSISPDFNPVRRRAFAWLRPGMVAPGEGEGFSNSRNSDLGSRVKKYEGTQKCTFSTFEGIINTGSDIKYLQTSLQQGVSIDRHGAFSYGIDPSIINTPYKSKC
jgi:hypothetical protein